LDFPLGIVAVFGAVALAGNLARLGLLDLRRAVGEIGWPIFGFIGGMLLVVRALDSTGITAQVGRLVAASAGGGHLAAIAATAAGTAVGANAINNLPMALVMMSAIHGVHVPPAVRSDMVYAAIVGADLGPNLTHLGSLATFIWLFFLRRKGLDVSTWDYFRIGVVVTPIMVLGAVLGLWLTSSV
jgi:arsenical pump membrane protein